MTSIAGVQSPNIQGHPNFPYLIGGKIYHPKQEFYKTNLNQQRKWRSPFSILKR
jgi:hypothetical protein